ncbi:SRPBCC domain-containing protein [Polaribacter haliotis]|uniref:SRPBCC domain-containing protein n=1 Tax=Polaribacter haliotis TaxID=1888915 RepID=A0A7L8AHH8_9FLAO|nr:SRPBCC domain-containing protein [Polaribacter haliotis]QOD61249.1 SRPBCC domain-containing protein [Polaribacter haliotis]
MENKTDFKVNKENNTITIQRKFSASRQLVWDCYTKPTFLEQWFAPKPLTAKTKTIDFSEGGYWLYAMMEPNGTEHWGRTDFIEIKPIEFYKSLDGFCDENGKINPEMPRAKWYVKFIDLNEASNVETIITYNTLKDLETVINMGMREGLASALKRLDELLTTL